MSEKTFPADITENFNKALKEFSERISVHSPFNMEKLVIMALRNEKVQKHFLHRLTQGQAFMNATVIAMPYTPGQSRVIFNFIYLPPKISLMPLSFAVVIENATGVVRDITDPYSIYSTVPIEEGIAAATPITGNDGGN